MRKISKLIPNFILRFREDFLIKTYANRYKTEILNFIKSTDFHYGDQGVLYEYIKNNGIHVFPYSFTKKYDYNSVKVHFDHSCNLYYVIHKGKKLYYKRGMSVRQIQRRYNMSLIEQDPESAHSYVDNNFVIKNGSVLTDIGVAEGNFSLDNIEKVSHVHLFEADSSWIEALEKTFEPWKNKVTINNKFVSNKLDESHTTIDEYFNKVKLDFIKIDVDGGERNLLNGADQTLNRSNLKIALCTYHNQNDWSDFRTLLSKYSNNITSSPNYMLFYFDPNFRAPYFRKGIMRIET